MCWLAVTTEPDGKNSVYPSGAARAASAAPTPPPAPPRFSITTCWFQIWVSFSPSSRAEMSVAPPGGNGTMKRTGFCGHPWAPTPVEASATSAAARSLTKLIRISLLKLILQRQGKRQPHRDRKRGRRGRERFLPVVPRQKFQRQHPQPPGEMRRQRNDDRPLAELHQRLPGPFKERVHLERR